MQPEHVLQFLPLREIPKDIARKRHDHFKSTKIQDINSVLTGAKNHPEFIRYSGVAFLSLLEIAKKEEFNGMRIYFACYVESHTGYEMTDRENDRLRIPRDSDNNKMTGYMTLVFAMTKGDDIDDDRAHYYTFDATGSMLIHLDLDTANEWVKKYQEDNWIWKKLSQNAKLAYQIDTKCLWCDAKDIAETYQKIYDQYIPDIDTLKMTAFFSAYNTAEEDVFQEFNYGPKHGLNTVEVTDMLTVVFGTGATPDTTMAFSEYAADYYFDDPPEDYDTAAPCPPAQGCGTPDTNLPLPG